MNIASRKFWLKVKQVFSESRMEILQGDEAFYYRHNGEGDLERMISSHVDDFILARTTELMEQITEKVKEKLDISKLEDNMFRFNGIDVFKEEDWIVIIMEEYAKSLEKLEIRKVSSEEKLTEAQLKVFRKYKGKLNWLSSDTTPDLAVYVIESARKQKKATLKELRNINRILGNIVEKENKVVF